MHSVGWIKACSDGSADRIGFGGSASLDPRYNSKRERTEILRSRIWRQIADKPGLPKYRQFLICSVCFKGE